MFRDKPIILLALGQITVWAGLLYVFPALLLRWEQGLGWERATLAGAITLAVVVSALFAPIAGRIIDLDKGPELLGAGALLGGASLFGLSFVGAVWQFYLVWAVIGVAFSCSLYEPCFALVTRYRNTEARQGIIAITLIAGFAGGLSFPSAHALSESFGWQNCLRIFASAVVLLSAPLLWQGGRLLRVQAGPLFRPGGGDGRRTHGFLTTPLFWALGIGFSLVAIMHGAVLYHLLPVLAQRAVATELAVTIAALIGPMQVAGRLVIMAGSRSMSNHGIAVSCFVLMTLSIAILTIAGANAALLVVFVVMFGGSYGIVSIIRPVIARELLGQENFGAKSGALALIYLLGSAAAPLIASVVWQLGGYQLVLSGLLALGFGGLGLYLLAHRLRPVPANQPD